MLTALWCEKSGTLPASHVIVGWPEEDSRAITDSSQFPEIFSLPTKRVLDLPQQLTEILTEKFIISGTFEDKEITHVEGEVDPVRDLDIINEELRLKDEEAFLKYFDDLEKKYQRGEKKLKQEYVS